jgi:hypothetical protein
MGAGDGQRFILKLCMNAWKRRRQSILKQTQKTRQDTCIMRTFSTI